MSIILLPGHKQRFWAYLDDRGVIHVKPYTGDAIIQRTEQLPFCRGIFDPFPASCLAEAKQICKIKLQEVQYYEKRKN